MDGKLFSDSLEKYMHTKRNVEFSLDDEDPLCTFSIKEYFNLRINSGINIILLIILIAEIVMPHKLLAKTQQDIPKFRDLVLSSDVYAFNDRYVPEEIKLQKEAEDKKLKKMKAVPVQEKIITATAYSSTIDQCDNSPFIAASGMRVHDGMVAANFLKFGTRVRFPDYFGDKIFVVEDRMNKRFSDRVDIWMNTKEEALNFGIRKVRVEILQNK